MTEFDLQNLRDIANEGIARHGLRGYARKLGLDVSTMRSLRDGRDMQISKLVQIVAAMELKLVLAPSGPAPDLASEDTAPGDMLSISYHPKATPREGLPAAPIAVHRTWLEAHGWKAEHIFCLHAPTAFHGGEMGCVSAGAFCLVECSEPWPEAHALWAYLEEGTLKLGHVGRPKAGLLLFSGEKLCDAPRMVSGAALDRIEPLGRVIWAGAPTCSDWANPGP